MDVMDNEISIKVEEGEEEIVSIAGRIREAAAESAYETDEKQLPHDQLTSVALPASDWRFAVRTVAHWAEVADGMTTDVGSDGAIERDLLSNMTRQLPTARPDSRHGTAGRPTPS
ncbi:hypothetical protein M1L60_01850 [Actinoplanes sp. TRM 88003]|uniref:Uncharacterized protein n=1 Tax=Paractinoplanes aksuensis TaxID=2939490 RepID=A0ABT1DET8_9ACTN|nr:hypothetical protein [Actinoplanes aksuensis]MCO8269329.1 hypothetical protein [Actinoplanes aksuensis]